MSLPIPTIPHSDKMPEIGQMYDIKDLFANFAINWFTLSPVMTLLLGIFFAFFVLKKIIKSVRGDDGDDDMMTDSGERIHRIVSWVTDKDGYMKRVVRYALRKDR